MNVIAGGLRICALPEPFAHGGADCGSCVAHPLPKSTVELDDCNELIALRLRQGILSREKLLLCFEHFVVAWLARFVALAGNADGFRIRIDGERPYRGGIGDFAAMAVPGRSASNCAPR
jgi:hypothetical protein